MKLRVLVAAGTILVLTAGASAQPSGPGAAEAKGKATLLIKEASRAYKAGDYADALAKFQEAYATFASPRVLFNIGQAQRKLSRPVEATEAFERFLASGGNAPAAARTEAQKSLEDMRHEVARIEVEGSAAGAEVSIDGQARGRMPLARPVLVSAGTHQVLVQRDGSLPFVRTVDVAGDTIVRVQVELAPVVIVPLPPPPPPPPAVVPVPALQQSDASAPGSRSTWQRKVGVGLLVAAPALAGTGLYFGMRARDKAQSITVACARSCAGADILEDDRARRRLGTTQWVLLGTAAGALAGGAVLYWLGGRDAGEPRVALAVGGGGGIAALAGRW